MVDASRFTSGMTVGTQPPLSRIKLVTSAAARTGFDVAWVTDHFLSFFPRVIWDKEFTWAASPEAGPHQYYDYQALMGFLAKRNIHVGVGVTEPIRRHPVLLAQFALTMSHLAKRAPILGIGSGERENVDPYGLSFERPVSRLEEALQVIRLCFESSGPIDFSGEFFTLDRAVMDLQADPAKRPQVWVAAHGPRMLRLTGEYGDGWYPTFPMSLGDYEQALRTIRDHAVRVDRDPAAIVPGWQLFSVTGRTEAHARELMASPPVRFVSLLAPAYLWESVGMEHPFGPEFRGMIDFVPQDYSKKQLEDAMSRVDPDVLSRVVIWGTPQSIGDQLLEYVELGLRHLVLQPAAALVSRRDAIFSLRSSVAIQRRLRRAAAVNRR
jgi:phthiodiolone/phenolphthiodiolone dimycocerosates ketoreductase